MKSLHIGIDNGVTGTIAFNWSKGAAVYRIPVKKQLDYQKTKPKNITRVSVHDLIALFRNYNTENCLAVIERPMINSKRFTSSKSAIRCLEATLICLEYLEIPYMYIDSKHWQKFFLPIGTKKEQLKPASKDIGIRLFPQHKEFITKHGDADGLLIAEWARRNNL